MKPISVIIPVRQGGNPDITLRSLAHQTVQNFDILISHDEGKGANWARNRGAELSKADLLLFSDDDIEWTPSALQILEQALSANPTASYAFGSYEMGGQVQCQAPFNAHQLRRYNIASTMALIRREHFPGFDESLQRLQDWDLFLTMLSKGHAGVQCGRLTFRTQLRDGITQNGPVAYDDACDVIARKHGLREEARPRRRIRRRA